MSELDHSHQKDEEHFRKEFKTDPVTEIGYASIRGMARLAGVNDETLRLSLKSAAQDKPSKLAETLIKKGFNVPSFHTEGIPDIAVGVILEYYAFDAGKRCTEQALKSYRAMSAIGIRAYIQNVTGWKRSTTESVEEFVQRQLPIVPNPWECRYIPLFWEKLKNVYGLERGHQGCAAFINAYIYNVFPPEVRTRIEEINPLNEKGNRANKKHQHFNGIFLDALKKQIENVMFLLDVAKDKDDFIRLAKRMKKLKLVPKTPSLPPTTETEQ